MEKVNKRILFIISLWFIIILGIFFNPNRPVYKQNYYLLGGEDSQILLDTNLTFQDKELFPVDMDINFYGITIPLSLINDSQKLCIDSIYINITASLPRISRKEQEALDYYDQILPIDIGSRCIDKNDIRFLGNNNEIESGNVIFSFDYSEKLQLPYISLDYYIYPYNQIILTSDNIIRLSIYDGEGKFVEYINSPVLSRFYIDEPGWEVNNKVSGSSYEEIRYSRPILYWILTPVLMVILFILSIYISTLDSYTNQIELALGLFLGVWGIRQVLLPESIYGISFVDYYFLGVYTIIGISLVISPLNNFYNKIKNFIK